MRSRFEEQLNMLHMELLEMGALIEQAISAASRAWENCDAAEAQNAMELERRVDQKERDIEALCLKLLLRQQPVARDLRRISAALKMITDMERIGDQASDIANIAIHIARYDDRLQPTHLPAMAAATGRMVTASVDAFVRQDLALARQTVEMDDGIDTLFDETKRELIGLIRRDVKTSEQAIDLLMIAKYFERIGDHAQNIAEWVEFSITGMHKGETL